MAERSTNLSDILDKHFKSDALKLKTLFLVERIRLVEGVRSLILGKFKTGDFRFYAI